MERDREGDSIAREASYKRSVIVLTGAKKTGRPWPRSEG